MAKASTPAATTGWRARLFPRRRPLRRASDPTLLLGHAGPLTTGSISAVVAGVVLALTMSRALAPYAFTLSSVVAVGLLGAARRADVAARPDHQPDKSARSRRVAAAVVVLALVGTGLSAWTIALDFAR